MKSAYYLATVVGCYRKVIDLYLNKGKLTEEEIKAFETEISKAENRLTSTGFLNKDVTINEQLYDTTAEHPTKEYIGYVLDYDENNQIATGEEIAVARHPLQILRIEVPFKLSKDDMMRKVK